MSGDLIPWLIRDFSFSRLYLRAVALLQGAQKKGCRFSYFIGAVYVLCQELPRSRFVEVAGHIAFCFRTSDNMDVQQGGR